MPVATTDLVAYCAVDHPSDDTSQVGGAIDTNVRVEFTDLAANDDVEVISTSASDTMNATLVGRNAAGELVQETKALTGTTAAVFSTAGVLERVESLILASDAVGTVTVRRSVAGATIATIPVGERGFRRLFINAVSSPDSTKDYYEKFFFRNNHATLALLSAAISESADPTTLITFAIGTAVNDSVTSTNRLTVPASGVTAFDNTAKNVPGTNLAAGAAIAVWVKLSLAQNNAPNKSTWTAQIAGSSA